MHSVKMTCAFVLYALFVRVLLAEVSVILFGEYMYIVQCTLYSVHGTMQSFVVNTQ